MVTRGEVKGHTEGFTKRVEEVGNKLRTSVGSDVTGNSMLGEHLGDEKLCYIRGGDGVVGQDKDPLFGELVYCYVFFSLAPQSPSSLSTRHP